ncbi:MAG: ribose 5-phosphate isomerase B [Magnetococcales bacterium]|nr:ribose 5-phosphate isomerase B [Magnetococcales bacterium]NGZ28564.1 ribose 5-phosphate isomerase B [Magnetococcales bacterium]
MKLLVACDHGGFTLKDELLHYLKQRDDVTLINLGVDSADSVDYPAMAARLCTALLAGEGERGLLLCGTGIGISMAANRFPGIRAALCHDETTARLSREHNDANILVLGGRTTGYETARAILDIWLTTPFAGGRHLRRIQQLDLLPNKPA